MKKQKHDYSSTQVELPIDLGKMIAKVLSDKIDKNDLHPTETNDVFHITVRYGLHTTDVKDVELNLDQNKIDVSISVTDIFKIDDEDYDVLIHRIDSPDLNYLNEKLGNLPNTSTHPFYQPHMTLCYLKRGTGEKYKNLVTGLEGTVLSFNKLVFSSAKGNKIAINLEKSNFLQKISRNFKHDSGLEKSFVSDLFRPQSFHKEPEKVKPRSVSADYYTRLRLGKLERVKKVSSGKFRVHFADGTKHDVKAKTKWEALQYAKESSKLAPIKVEEIEKADIHVKPFTRIKHGKIEMVGSYRKTISASQIKKEINRDKKIAADVIGVEPKNLKYVGVQEAYSSVKAEKPDQYMHLWNIEKPGYPSHGSTRTSGVHYILPKEIRQFKGEVKKEIEIGSEEDWDPDNAKIISQMLKNYNIAGVDFESTKLPQAQVLNVFKIQLEKLSQRVQIDGRNKLLFVLKNLTKEEGGAKYLDNEIDMDDAYVENLSHEYAHFVFDKTIGDTEDATWMYGLQKLNVRDDITTENINNIFSEWEEQFQAENIQQKAHKELIHNLRDFYANNIAKIKNVNIFFKDLPLVESSRIDKDWMAYFFDLNEVFARAYEAYVAQKSSKFIYSKVEDGPEYFNIVNAWGDKYLKTGIIKSLDDLDKSRVYVPYSPYHRAYFREDPRDKKWPQNPPPPLLQFKDKEELWQTFVNEFVDKGIKDPQGDQIEFSVENFEHMFKGHTEQENKYRAERMLWIRDIIQNPDLIVKDQRDPSARLFLKWYNGEPYLFVCKIRGIKFVGITAYPLENQAKVKALLKQEKVYTGPSVQGSDLIKARPYIRTRRGKLQHVAGYSGRAKVSQFSPQEKVTTAFDPNREDVKVANQIAYDIHQNEGRALFVGGSVRDALLGRPAKDIDIEVHGIEGVKLKEILQKIGDVNEVGAQFEVYKVNTSKLREAGIEALDVSIPNKRIKVAEGHKGEIAVPDPFMGTTDAARRRDLTINSISYDPITKAIIDPFGGQKDLENRKLRAVDETRFGEDPLRVLRVMRFAGQLGFTPDLKLVKICRSVDLTKLPKERIYGELEKLLMSRTPSIGLRLISVLGIDKILPELAELKGIPQDPKHHSEGDALRHTVMVTDEAAKWRKKFSNKKDKIVFMLSALLHDLGKPETTEIKPDGKITTYGHDDVGEEKAERFLRRITNEQDIIDKVKTLVKHHMKPTMLYHDQAKASGIRRLAKQVDIPTLVALAIADKTGRGKPYNIKAEQWFLKKYKELSLDKPDELKPRVSGKHLIEHGVQPGKPMGDILKKIYEAQIEGAFTTTEGGLEWAKKEGLIGFSYEEALKEVSQGGTPETRQILAEAIEKDPSKIKELQKKIKNDFGDKITLYRATRGKALQGIESFTDDLNVAKEMGFDTTINVPVTAIVGHYKYSPKETWRSQSEKEVLVDVKKMSKSVIFNHNNDKSLKGKLMIDLKKSRKKAVELRKSRLEGKLIPHKEDGKTRWVKVFKGGLVVKGNRDKVIYGSKVLVKSDIAKVTAIGKDGVIARSENGKKHQILFKDLNMWIDKR
jgi:tRNA nucleotidyltransferase (CCA-adding enzyme)